MCTASCCCSTGSVRHTAQCCEICAQPRVAVALAVLDIQHSFARCSQPGVAVAPAVLDIQQSIVRCVHSLVLL